MQLTEIADQFEELGINIATMTYDSVETLNTAAEDNGITFTLLHDEAVTHVDALGIRNPQYEPGHRIYGIPLPGIFLIGPDGVIRYKFSEERYQDRPDFAYILEAAAAMQ